MYATLGHLLSVLCNEDHEHFEQLTHVGTVVNIPKCVVQYVNQHYP